MPLLFTCIEQAGVLRYRGCPIPDSDKDGVNDEEDNCVQVFGLRSNQGCPEIKKELTVEMQKAAKNIFFETGSYKLLSTSYTALNKVTAILNENPDLNLLIEGHTDNQGNAESNQVLSENRAKAVLFYLKDKAINENRLKANGYGQTNPIDSNDNAEGRANNRRVEMKLYF